MAILVGCACCNLWVKASPSFPLTLLRRASGAFAGQINLLGDRQTEVSFCFQETSTGDLIEVPSFGFTFHDFGAVPPPTGAAASSRPVTTSAAPVLRRQCWNRRQGAAARRRLRQLHHVGRHGPTRCDHVGGDSTCRRTHAVCVDRDGHWQGQRAGPG